MIPNRDLTYLRGYLDGIARTTDGRLDALRDELMALARWHVSTDGRAKPDGFRLSEALAEARRDPDLGDRVQWMLVAAGGLFDN